MRLHELKDGEEIDLICWKEYGDLPGALEAVLRANWGKLHLFDKLGKAYPLKKPETIMLPELRRPTSTTKTTRIFD
ncbi:MAG: tail protein X [Pseudobdellovibrionaceae bacterium]|nr:tail protein X [Pseudobdellovibrionaceae bacterium]